MEHCRSRGTPLLKLINGISYLLSPAGHIHCNTVFVLWVGPFIGPDGRSQVQEQEQENTIRYIVTYSLPNTMQYDNVCRA